MQIRRDILDSLIDEFKREEISIILGPRQVGKTFLLNELKEKAVKQGLRVRYYNLEIPSDLIQFNKPDNEIFESLTKDVDILFIDEFHYIKNASRLFKAVFDSKKKVKIFSSGSSSIEIYKHLKESLAGRRLVTHIYPLNYKEFFQLNLKNPYEIYSIYGGLPGLVHYNDEDEKIRILNEILETYIQKDIKSLIRDENIRAFNMLLYLLAENQGGIIIPSNLAGEIGLTAKTVNKYLSILEQTYVLFPVGSYSKNIGNELKKSKKYYLYDTGIRNVLLKDFSRFKERDDAGVLNESFIYLQLRSRIKPNIEIKFWRNKQGQEIDFILLKNRKPLLIEVKTKLNSMDIPQPMKTFIKKYPDTKGGIVFSSNLCGEREYLGKKIFFKEIHKVNEFIDEFF